MANNHPKWLKKQKFSRGFSIIRARQHHDIKDFKLDNGCYILIRVYKPSHEIGVAICSYNHQILKEFRGRRATDIYHEIFRYDGKHSKGWFNRMDHAAYLGKELKKAEMALALGTDYIQD